MSLIWFFLGFLSAVFVIGFVYVANNHYRLRKEDWNGYEVDTAQYMMKGEM